VHDVFEGHEPLCGRMKTSVRQKVRGKLGEVLWESSCGE
jgi:hypothetical protein